jgi:hypothetical protein
MNPVPGISSTMQVAGPLWLIDDLDNAYLHHASTWAGPLELVSYRKAEKGTANWRENRNSVCVTVYIFWIYQCQAEIFA